MVLIRRLPLASRRIRSLLLVEKPSELAAGKYTPFVGALEPDGINAVAVAVAEAEIVAAVSVPVSVGLADSTILPVPVTAFDRVTDRKSTRLNSSHT